MRYAFLITVGFGMGGIPGLGLALGMSLLLMIYDLMG